MAYLIESVLLNLGLAGPNLKGAAVNISTNKTISMAVPIKAAFETKKPPLGSPGEWLFG
jgi:hypothetical protein